MLIQNLLTDVQKNWSQRSYLEKSEKSGFFQLLLKVPKREIFDRSDFPDFYTIKSLREGDFGVKIWKIKKNI